MADHRFADLHCFILQDDNNSKLVGAEAVEIKKEGKTKYLTGQVPGSKDTVNAFAVSPTEELKLGKTDRDVQVTGEKLVHTCQKGLNP